MSDPSARPARPAERLFPLALLTVVALVAVAVLPSALRPPPEQATDAAAFSPDAPEEESPDAIISSFTQAGSSTAGANQRSRSEEAAPVTTTTLPPEERATRGLCFGDPPRQTESLYSADCKPAFVGDNGGATYRNVSADEIRIGMWATLSMPEERGPVSAEPQPSESGATRTWRVFQQYFNARYETYDRRIQLVAIDIPDRSPPGQRAAAAATDEEQGVFASILGDRTFCDEYARRELLCMNINPLPERIYEDQAPHLWGHQMSAGRNDQLASEYVCKRLVGKPAAYAGTPDLQAAQRRIGLLFEVEPGRSGRPSADLATAIEETCGHRVAAAFDVTADLARGPGEVATAMAQMRSKGITTIVLASELITAIVAMQQADQSAYEPEWVQFGTYGLDLNNIAPLMSPTQTDQLFGLSGWEIPRPVAETECVRAYRTIDPNNNPDGGFCIIFWWALEQTMAGIQEAGPNLTPSTFEEGLFRHGKRYRPEPWAIQGGYAPGDRSYVDKMGEIWWDGDATDPQAGGGGAYRWLDGGRKYGPGEIPDGDVPLFESGILTTASMAPVSAAAVEHRDLEAARRADPSPPPTDLSSGRTVDLRHHSWRRRARLPVPQLTLPRRHMTGRQRALPARASTGPRPRSRRRAAVSLYQGWGHDAVVRARPVKFARRTTTWTRPLAQ